MLDAFQDALIALSADARVRKRFDADPEAALRDYDLDARERAALAAIPRADLERFATSLIAKRWSEVSRVVRLTLKVSPKLGERYRAWAASDPARAHDTVLSPGADEALRALAALRSALANDPIEAPYAADLLAYEVLGEASRVDGQPRFLTSRYAIQRIAADVRAGLLPMDPEAEPTQLRFDDKGARWRSAGASRSP